VRILATGGSGFIGKTVVSRLLVAHEVYCLVRDGRNAPPGSVPIVGDLALQVDSSNWPPFDGIIHLAQSTARGNFPGSASDAFAVNVAGLAQLLALAERAKVRRFVMASTGTVYESTTQPLREDAAVSPGGYYPASKLAAEVLLRPYASCMAACALRLFTPYGPGQSGRLIPQLIDRIRKGSVISLVGSDEGHVLAPTHVDDIARVFVTSIEDEWSGTLNVAAPEVLTIRQISQALGRALGIEPYFARQPGDTIRLFPDLTLLGRRYPLDRFRPFEEGLRSVTAE
jgi:UDP-glucose 4-epimerase